MPMSPRLLRPRASATSTGFDPRAISGLGVWYDASAASSITFNGSNVSQWNDLSGNNRHLTQGTALQQPGYQTNAQNGRAVLTFDGTNQRMLTTAGGASGVNSVSLFLVIRHTLANATEDTAFGIGTSGQARAIRTFYRAASSQTMSFEAWGLSAGTAAYSVDPGGTYHVFSILQTNRSVQIGRDGARTTHTLTNDPLAVTTNSVFIGGIDPTADNNPRHVQGSIAEAIAYYQDIGVSSAQQVERYLGAKWGITVA